MSATAETRAAPPAMAAAAAPAAAEAEFHLGFRRTMVLIAVMLVRPSGLLGQAQLQKV